MLKGVRGVWGSVPELMAGQDVAVPMPAALGSAAAWAPALGSRSGPPAPDPPPALGPSPVRPSSCAPTHQPRAAEGLELVDVPAAVYLQGREARREASGTTRQTGPWGFSALSRAAPCTLVLDPS